MKEGIKENILFETKALSYENEAIYFLRREKKLKIIMKNLRCVRHMNKHY